MFEISLTIDRPPRDVFAALARVEDAPLWYSAVTRIERVSGGPLAQGSRARFVRKLGGATVENEVTVSEFEPDKTFALKSISGPTPFTYRYKLEPSGDGTLLRLEGRISGEGLPGPLSIFGSFAETFFRRGMASNLDSLKRLIESG